MRRQKPGRDWLRAFGDQAKAIDDAFGTFPQKTLVIVASPDAKALPDLMSGAVAMQFGGCNQ